jgi:Papain family cysteine protease
VTVTILADLRSQFGPVRDQGARPTCLAFAASDAHAALRAGWAPLSCDYAFYHAQKRTGRSPTKGAFLDDVLAVLREEGQPIEAEWPYVTQLPTDLSLYHPPSSIGYRYGRLGEQPKRDFEAICAAIDNGTPAIVLSVLTSSYFNPPRIGIIDHIDGDEVFPTPRHAMIAVAYGIAGLQRVVLIRNSWGPTWGQNGHCWITEDFFARHMFGLAILKDECDVSSSTAAA